LLRPIHSNVERPHSGVAEACDRAARCDAAACFHESNLSMQRGLCIDAIESPREPEPFVPRTAANACSARIVFVAPVRHAFGARRPLHKAN
jgi:hypothetical protein